MKCPNGHDSTEPDFCSECGLEIQGGANFFPDDHTPLPSQLCPVCATDRDDPSSPFCGVCGYNFVTKVGGHVVQPAGAPPPTPKPIKVAAAHPPAAMSASAPRIEIEVTFDEGKAEAPKGHPMRKFSLYDEENLLGRRSTGVAQTIGLDGDDFISRRHLLIVRQKNGSYVARLFDNTNGGTHNGKEMTAGVEVPLAVNDKLGIGSYTVIRVATIK